MDPLTDHPGAVEALGCWTPDDVEALVAARWVPQLLRRFSQTVRQVAPGSPPGPRRALVSAARAVLAASPRARLALCLDPALARWTGAEARHCELAPRFELAVALLDGLDAELVIPLGPRGRARIPVDGRVLHGSAAVPVQVRGGVLLTSALPSVQAGPFSVIGAGDDEGRMPRFRPLASTAAARSFAPGAEILATTAPAVLAEAAALAPALLPIAAEPGVSRSASIPDVRSAIWLSPCDRPLVVAETLVHEASHLKYYLTEDAHPFAQSPDTPRYAVPWRPDPRPIRTVLMGLHAWVRVMEWLAFLAGGPWSQPAAQRLQVLRDANRAAVRIVASADGLTEAGRALGAALSARALKRA